MTDKQYNILVFIAISIFIALMWTGIIYTSDLMRTSKEYDSSVNTPAPEVQEVQPGLIRQAGKAFETIKSEFVEGMEDAKTIQKDQ